MFLAQNNFVNKIYMALFASCHMFCAFIRSLVADIETNDSNLRGKGVQHDRPNLVL